MKPLYPLIKFQFMLILYSTNKTSIFIIKECMTKNSIPLIKPQYYCEDILCNKTLQCNKRMQEKKNLLSIPFSYDKSKMIFKW